MVIAGGGRGGNWKKKENKKQNLVFMFSTFLVQPDNKTKQKIKEKQVFLILRSLSHDPILPSILVDASLSVQSQVRAEDPPLWSVF